MRTLITKDGNNTLQTISTADDLGLKISGDATSWQPFYDGANAGERTAAVDDSGNLCVRAQVLTDEGGFRANFANSSTWLGVGSGTFTNGSTQVTGLSGLLDADIRVGDYVAPTADHANAAQIEWFDDTSITLTDAFAGVNATGVVDRSIMADFAQGSATITVVNGTLQIATGVDINVQAGLYRFVDVPALISAHRVTASQRIANQTLYVGLAEVPVPTLAKYFAWFVFDGATNTQVKCVTGRNPTDVPSASEQQSTTITVTATTTAQEYRVEMLRDRALFFVDDVLKATHKLCLPQMSDHLYDVCRYVAGGTAPATTTTYTIDYVQVSNVNEVTTYPISREPQAVISTAAAPVIVRLTDGTNYHPTADAAARRSYTQITDGTNNVVVLATIGSLKTDLSSVAGTVTVNGGVAGLQGIGGSAANSAAATGNPVQTGGVVGTAYDTTYAAGDAARLLMSTSQQLVVTQDSVPEQTWQYAAAAGGIVNTTDVVAKAAAAAGIRNYVKSMQIKNANAVATEFVIKDGATVIWRGHLAATMGTSDPIIFDPPLRGTAATAVNIACVTTGAQVYANLTGFLGA